MDSLIDLTNFEEGSYGCPKCGFSGPFHFLVEIQITQDGIIGRMEDITFNTVVKCGNCNFNGTVLAYWFPNNVIEKSLRVISDKYNSTNDCDSKNLDNLKESVAHKQRSFIPSQSHHDDITESLRHLRETIKLLRVVRDS